MAFKEPPALKMSQLAKKTTEVSKNAPTAENLRRLNTTGGRSDTAPKSARRSEVSAGKRSYHSGQGGGGDPADPYKEHSVEQMDTLIATTTLEINRLMVRKKAFESDGLATKTTIRAKVKPIVEEMNMLRVKLLELQTIRDAKIPDHEKLPRDCIFYKHYIQVDMNQKIEELAKQQIREDRELLQEIGQGLSPKKGQKEDLAPPADPDKAETKKR